MWLGRKLERASPPPKALLRPRLFSILDRWESHRVILIRAAAGYGKSSLVATWVATRKTDPTWARVAWLAADPEDADPVRFIHYVAAAFDTVLPGAMDVVLPILADRQPEPANALAKLLAFIQTTLEANSDTRVLFIVDDYHQIQSPDVNSLLSFLIDHAPDQVGVVILSRNMPELSLARLYVSGQLLELTAEDLKLTLPELRQLLDAMDVTGLSSDQLEHMLTHTEGWIAGLKLAGMSLAGNTHPETVLGQLRGTSHWQAEYLSGEVLYKQPTELRRFLLQTSILDRLHAGLCATITQDEGATQLLAEAYGAGLFLVALDNTRTWFRYHPIFQELLQLRLREQLGDSAVSELHRRAGEWFAGIGDIDSAAHHFAAAGATDRVVALLEEPICVALNGGNLHQAQVWLMGLPSEILEHQPRLLLYLCRLNILREEHELLSNVAKAARVIRTADVDAETRARLEAELEVYQAAVFLRQNRHEHLAEAISRASGRIDLLDDFSRGTLEFLGLHYDFLRQPWDVVIQHAQRAVTAFERADFIAGVIAVQRELAMMSRAQGRLLVALRGLETIIQSYPAPQPHLYRELQSVHQRTADIHYWADDIDMALHHATEAARLAEMLDDGDIRHSISRIIKLIEFTGLNQQEIAEKSAGASTSTRPRANFDIDLEVRYMLRIGQHENALRHKGLQSIDPLSDPNTVNPVLINAYASSYVATGKDLEAIGPLIRGSIERFRAQSTPFYLVRMLATEAWRLDQLQLLNEATDVLAEAVSLGNEIGIVRHILDMPQLSSLLSRLDDPVADKLLARMMWIAPEPSSDALATLTSRERDILALLAQDYRYQDVADSLFISIDTVRKHATSIYRKLGVNRRLAAVEIARQLGLVQSNGA